MKKHSIGSVTSFTIAVLCLLAVIISTVLADSGTIPLSVKGTAPLTDITTKPLATLQCKYYNEKDFMSSVIAARQNQFTAKQNKTATKQNIVEVTIKSSSVAGGIVPHHLLAGKMIAEFFQALSIDNPEIVVVIAPNHRRIGVSGLHTSIQSWATAFGVLEADSELTGKLIKTLNASQNTALMEEEHSISSLVPYIKYYLPQAKIVPVLLHGNYTAKESQKLGDLLSETLSDNPRAAIIASVDFSHYLDVDTADKMDEITLAAIKSGDIPSISIMGNDNLDSPPSIMTLLSAMEEMGTSVPEVLSHGNSSDITGSGADYTTSYYTMIFKR